MYFFGGGWTLGSIDTSDGVCRALANAAGCQVVTPGYRLAPEHPFPAAVHDCHAAVEWVAAHAAELGADPDRLAVGGDSAGGNLAAVVTLLARDRGGPALAAQLLVYPNTCYHADTDSLRANDDRWMFNRNSVDWYWRNYLPTRRPGATRWCRRCSPRTSPGLPPALVITAEYDPLRDEGERYAGPAARGGRGRRDHPLRRHGPRFLHDVGRARRRPAGRRGGGRVPAEAPHRWVSRGRCAWPDMARLAEALLPPEVWDYISGGSGAETTLAANRAALDGVALLPRVLRRRRAGEHRRAGCWAPSRPCRSPWRRWPTSAWCTRTASSRPPRPRGEAGIPYVVSTLASVPAGGDRRRSARTSGSSCTGCATGPWCDDLVARAEQAGCQALMVTVDVPIMGRRLRDLRNAFALPADVVAANLDDGATQPRARHGGRASRRIAAHTASAFAPGLDWADLEWLRARTSPAAGGQGHPRPARRGARRGVRRGRGGGVQPRRPAARRRGAQHRRAARGRRGGRRAGAQVLLDSGIRSGTDVLRALALGAARRAGRPAAAVRPGRRRRAAAPGRCCHCSPPSCATR